MGVAQGALTLVALAELGQAMRLAQGAYFASRRNRGITNEESQQLMVEARRLEGEFDAALRRVLRPSKPKPLPGQTSFLDSREV